MLHPEFWENRPSKTPWLTANLPSPEEEWRALQRQKRMWRGPRPRPAEHAKSRRGGIRKPRQGGHIKSKTRR